MIEETRLRQLLEAAAAAHPVPEGGPAAVLEAASEPAPAAEVVELAERRARRYRRLAVAAVFVLVAGVGALLVREASRPEKGLSVAASSSAGADAPGRARAAAPSSTALGPASAAQPGAAPSADSRGPGPLIDLEVDPATFAALDTRLSDIARARGGALLATVSSGSRFQAVIQVPSQAVPAVLDDLRRLGRVVEERSGPLPDQAATATIDVTVTSAR